MLDRIRWRGYTARMDNTQASGVSPDVIMAAVARVVMIARPKKVIVFGSYARGDQTPDSDLDLMVIVPGRPDKSAEMMRLRRAIGMIGIGVDVLVLSEEEAARRGQVPGTTVYWANREGKVLYEAPS